MQVVHTFLCFHSLLGLFGAVWLTVCVCVCMQFACPRALWFLIYRQTSGQRGRQGPRHCGRHVSATEAPAFTVNARESEAIMAISFFSQFFHRLFHSQSVSVPLSHCLTHPAQHCSCWAASHSMAAIVVAGIRAMADGSSLSSLLWPALMLMRFNCQLSWCKSTT